MSGLPEVVRRAVEQLLKETTGKETLVTDFRPASGGCINNGGRLSTSGGTFFLKWNDSKRYPDMFAMESNGLELLHQSGAVKVPKVVAHGEAGGHQFLILEYVSEGPQPRDYFVGTASQLAALHRVRGKQYGWTENNYMGSLVQRNDPCDSWIDFFIQHRLDAQLRLAVDDGKLERAHIRLFEQLYKELSSLLSVEPPVLVHGDLWNGNLMCDTMGDPCFIDPAVYYGHREIDLAMTRLFGGFADEFYSTYMNEYPLPPGLPQRLEVYNLYPLLVHVNLFGGGYATQVLTTLRKFN